MMNTKLFIMKFLKEKVIPPDQNAQLNMGEGESYSLGNSSIMLTDEFFLFHLVI